MAKKIFLSLLILTFTSLLWAVPKVNYTKLSDEAKRIGQLDFYNNIPKTKGSITMEGYQLDYSVPSTVRAYDSIPITYTLTQKPGIMPIDKYISAVAYEDSKKAKNRNLYDMTIPGRLEVKIEYLGNTSADYDDTNYPYLTPDPKEAKPLDFMPLKRYDFVKSSTAKAADCVWFKFKVTNTGNTILDPEGFGKDFGYGTIVKLKADGSTPEWETPCSTINEYDRHLNYIYPGDSWTFWVQFNCSKYLGWPGRQLTEGEYKIKYSMLYKYNREYNYNLNVWHGREFAYLEVPISVKKDAVITPINAKSVNTDKSEKMPAYFNKFEEFMTSFNYYDKEDKRQVISDTIYLQVAPWSNEIVLKLLAGNNQIKTARIPVNMNLDTLDIKKNPNNPMVITNADGTQEAAIVAQAMPGMRSNFQLGPYPENHMEDEIAEMKDLGVNLIANTSGSWWIAEVSGQQAKDHILEPCKIGYRYWYDYLMRKYDMKAIGWSIYPPSHTFYLENANAAFNTNLTYSPNPNTYPQKTPGIDLGDPAIPKLLGIWSKYTYDRWGDYWFTDTSNKTAVDCEDTWGWMRMDINNRLNLGAIGTEKFRTWLKNKYTTIDAVNTAWKSNFADFNAIDPDKVNSFVENKEAQEFYNASDPIFHDWTPAMEDLDIFRTQLRMDTYSEANKLIHEFLPTGQIGIRTEGANIIAKGDPKSDNYDMRHIYYSQRRDATVYDIVKESQAIHSYSDYTTILYTISDWRRMTKESTEAGVINAPLPTFAGMRDVLINDFYGKDYQVSYNLDTPKKGMMIHAIQSAYPVWKAIYEEGGAPGTIWADYLCDGFVTETQKKEIKLLSEHLKSLY